MLAANRLFKAILGKPSGVTFAMTEPEHSWQAVRMPGNKIQLAIPELLPEIAKLAHSAPPHDAAYPFILCAGERRSETSNTSIRDASWHRKGLFGTLRISTQDAAALGCADGEWVRISTRRNTVNASLEITNDMPPGNISLPNGLGIDYRRADGTLERRGVSLNELTGTCDRDPFAGTPWHKRVPARVERIHVSETQGETSPAQALA